VQFGLNPDPPTELDQGGYGSAVPLPAYLHTCISKETEMCRDMVHVCLIPAGSQHRPIWEVLLVPIALTQPLKFK